MLWKKNNLKKEEQSHILEKISLIYGFSWFVISYIRQNTEKARVKREKKKEACRRAKEKNVPAKLKSRKIPS